MIGFRVQIVTLSVLNPVYSFCLFQVRRSSDEDPNFAGELPEDLPEDHVPSDVDLGVDDDDDEDFLTYELPPMRIPHEANKFTAEELWSIILTHKIAHGVPDNLAVEFASVFSQMSSVPSPELPTSTHLLQSRMNAMMPVKPTFHVFCQECNIVCCTSPTRVRAALCPSCKKDLKRDLRTGNAIFVTYSVREQLQCLMKNDSLRQLIRRYASQYRDLVGDREPYRTILREGNLNVSLCTDAAPLTTRSGVQIYPAILVINNIPVSSQLRFPILAALFCAKGEKPKAKLFLGELKKELLVLAENPIRWVDDLQHEHVSRVFLTSVSTDCPEKATTLLQKTSGYFSCPYCEAEGTIITRTLFPEVWTNNPFNPYPRKESLGGVKFPHLVHESSCRRRENEDRLRIGSIVVQEKVERRLHTDAHHIKGIKGIPALHSLPYFEDVWGHTSDTLHVICEGIVADIMTLMATKTGEPHHFRRGNDERYWEYYHEIQDTVKRVSELDQVCGYLKKCLNYKGIERFNFITAEVALLCSDEGVYRDTELYQVLVHLANVTYLLHHGRLKAELLVTLREEVQRFASTFKAKFKASRCTWKFHVLQHFPDLAEKHGPAFLWDAFNFERMLGMMKRDVTATRNQLCQASRNFMLRFQALPLQKTEHYHKDCLEIMRSKGLLPAHAALAQLSVEPMSVATADNQQMPDDIMALFREKASAELRISFEAFNATPKSRILRLRR